MTSLRQRMIEDMHVRNLSLNTERAYVETVARFARHFGRSPAVLGPEEIRAYQVYVTTERKLAPSSLPGTTITGGEHRLTYPAAQRRFAPITMPDPRDHDGVDGLITMGGMRRSHQGSHHLQPFPIAQRHSAIIMERAITFQLQVRDNIIAKTAAY